MSENLPLPPLPIAMRIGTRADIPFIDALQKEHSNALGFFPRAQLEGYIDNGWVLIAEMNGSPVGYVASRDRYLKRDELGVIYQLCVSRSVQRTLVGASLIKAVFERSAYGCKLYCCWCAQDLAANRFWESLGFVPIAFRGGGRGRVRGSKFVVRGDDSLPRTANHEPRTPSSRVHIFWQKRIRSNDTTTPWWFPAKTEGGAIREDRLVLPIPPGLHWSDPMPVLASAEWEIGSSEKKRKRSTPPSPPSRPAADSALRTRVRFGPPGAAPMVVPAPAESNVAPMAIEAVKREPRRVDPKMIVAVRELRDRYLEQVNATPMQAFVGKYDVSRAIAATVTIEATRLLSAA